MSLSSFRRPSSLLGTALLLFLTGPVGVAQAQPRDAGPAQARDFGQREFSANCASCHGADAKGRGPVAGFLTRNPPDLTQISRSNGGVFPMERLYRVIDGTELPEGSLPGPHGSREMPVWGRDYRVRDAEHYVDVPYNADALVRGRILALLEYLHRLQQR